MATPLECLFPFNSRPVTVPKEVPSDHRRGGDTTLVGYLWYNGFKVGVMQLKDTPKLLSWGIGKFISKELIKFSEKIAHANNRKRDVSTYPIRGHVQEYA